MKKDLATHFSFMIALFILISLFKRWIDLQHLPFWFGGILGTIMPDVDYLIYAYLIHPEDQASQKIVNFVSQRQVVKTWDLLATTQRNLPELLVHSATFQVIFVIFALLVVTSTGSLLGLGLVLAFMLHLLVDEVVDLVENKDLDRWFQNFPVSLDAEQKRWYLVANGAALLIFGFLL